MRIPVLRISELSDDSDTEAGDDDDEDEDEVPRPTFSFPRLDAEIRSALEKYEGAVFPKLNWSSPQVRVILLPSQLWRPPRPTSEPSR